MTTDRTLYQKIDTINLIKSLISQSKMGEAFYQCSRFLEKYPTPGEVYFYRAQCYIAQEDYVSALSDLKNCDRVLKTSKKNIYPALVKLCNEKIALQGNQEQHNNHVNRVEPQELLPRNQDVPFEQNQNLQNQTVSVDQNQQNNDLLNENERPNNSNTWTNFFKEKIKENQRILGWGLIVLGGGLVIYNVKGSEAFKKIASLASLLNLTNSSTMEQTVKSSPSL